MVKFERLANIKIVNKIISLITIPLVLILPFIVIGSADAQKVNSSLNSITLNEGSSQTIDISLPAPIICSGVTNPCQVAIDFSSNDSSHVSFSTDSIVIPSNEWFQVFPLTINTVDDGIYNSGESDIIYINVVSDSTYYNGFNETIPLTINNIDPMPPAPGILNSNVNVPENTSENLAVLNGVSGNPDPTTLTIVSGPSHGVAVVSSGDIAYTPSSNYVGADSLFYSVCSLYGSSVCGTATLSFNVAADTVASPSRATPDTGFGSPISKFDSNLAGLMIVTAIILISFSVRDLYKNKR